MQHRSQLVHMIIMTKGKIENKTYFDLAPTRVAIDENDS